MVAETKDDKGVTTHSEWGPSEGKTYIELSWPSADGKTTVRPGWVTDKDGNVSSFNVLGVSSDDPNKPPARYDAKDGSLKVTLDGT